MYTKHVKTKETAQTEPIFGRESEMIKNNAGGYNFQATVWTRLNRFLILGAEGKSFYQDEKKRVLENTHAIKECLKEDGLETVRRIVDVSLKGRAKKQEPTLFALACAATFGDPATQKAVYDAIHKVCRTGTMLFTFTGYIQDLRGWSAGLRKGVSKFYTERDAKSLDLQLVKYRQRNGFTHRDVLRLAHPKAKDQIQNQYLRYAVGKESAIPEDSMVNTYEEIKNLELNRSNTIRIVGEILDKDLPREAIPTQFLTQPVIWEALLEKMPMTALIRNLNQFAKLEMTLSNMSDTTNKIVNKLTNPIAINKSRVHPMQILIALKTYASGRGFKGADTWSPNSRIVKALDSAFYESFDNVTPTNKKQLIGIDISGSMGMYNVPNSNLTCMEAAAAMAMVIARSEPNYDMMVFSDKPQMVDISPTDRLDDVMSKIFKFRMGATDCSLPMIYAHAKKLDVDTFSIYTDNETYAGKMHPKQALDGYRKSFNPEARLAVVAFQSVNHTIADPADSGMLDISGFDTATPKILEDFNRGLI
jgi:60 kDa SS-A/Ro ribonucleoprotein